MRDNGRPSCIATEKCGYKLMQWTDRHICIGRKCIELLHEFQSWHEIRNICERKTPVWKNYEPWFRVGNTKHCVQSANCPGNKAQKQTGPAVPDTRISPKFFLSPASGTLSHHTYKKREKRLFHSYKDDKIMVVSRWYMRWKLSLKSQTTACNPIHQQQWPASGTRNTTL